MRQAQVSLNKVSRDLTLDENGRSAKNVIKSEFVAN